MTRSCFSYVDLKYLFQEAWALFLADYWTGPWACMLFDILIIKP